MEEKVKGIKQKLLYDGVGKVFIGLFYQEYILVFYDVLFVS